MGNNRFKYILLGLGIGIVLTNLIYYYNPRVEIEELDDGHIIERARDLGMVPMKENIEVGKIEVTEAPSSVDKEVLDRANQPFDIDENQEEAEIKEEKLEAKEFSIAHGDGLLEVRDNLYDMGLIEDRESFESKVYKRGLAKRLQTGVFFLDKGLDDNEIIDIITGQPHKK